MAEEPTTQPVAPVTTTGQPTASAVLDAPAQQALPIAETTAAPAKPAEQPAAPERLWAGKYKTPEELERGYSESSSEAHRLQQELLTVKTQPVGPIAPAAQPFTPQQLNTMKQEWLVEAATKPERAADAARQIVLIDDELRNQAFSQFTSKQTSAAAYARLQTDVQPIFDTYKADIQPGMPLHTQAHGIYQEMVASGMAANEATGAAALLLALAKSGKFQQGVAAKASADATKNLNQAIKGAAAAGSGAANTNAAPGPDFTKFDPKTPAGRVAFAEYRKSLKV